MLAVVDRPDARRNIWSDGTGPTAAGRGEEAQILNSTVGLIGTRRDLCLIDDPKSRAAAALLRDEGLRLVGEIGALIGLEPNEVWPTALEGRSLYRRLASAKTEPDLEEFAQKRSEHARCIEAIAAHLGTPTEPLLP